MESKHYLINWHFFQWVILSSCFTYKTVSDFRLCFMACNPINCHYILLFTKIIKLVLLKFVGNPIDVLDVEFAPNKLEKYLPPLSLSLYLFIYLNISLSPPKYSESLKLNPLTPESRNSGYFDENSGIPGVIDPLIDFKKKN
jgi:hypothetical protein